MEDSSDTNRDTDVSSTTADVPETQEVTGSNGNVEMIITVEKVEEDSFEETDSSEPITQEQNNYTLTNVKTSVKEKSLSKESVQESHSPKNVTSSPEKESMSSKALPNSPSTTSPTKDKSSDKIIVRPFCTTSPKNEVNISSVGTTPKVDQGKPTSTSPIKESEETVDSSSKTLSPSKGEVQVKKEDLTITPTIIQNGNEAQKKQTDVSIATTSEVNVPETTTHSLEKSTTEVGDSQKADENLKTVVDSHCEKSNDSQLDTSSDISEKEHNKSISRELKSLIKSAKESKIISECTQLTSKTRKSRTPMDTSANLNISAEPEKINSIRRNSNISSKSNGSEKSEKTAKRSMRSQNPEFVHKVKQFLNSVTGKNRDSDDDQEHESKDDASPSSKKKKITESQHLDKVDQKLRADPYCWRCHWPVETEVNEKSRPPMACTVCPRVFHYKCLSSSERNKIDIDRSWVCPECLSVLHAESSETRSVSMKKISLGLLCELLQHALTRMMELNGVEPFMQPVDRTAFPDYDKYVVQPMDLSLMKKNIGDGVYGSTEAFLADAQWILHNSIIFNTLQSKLTLAARALVRLCRSEMGEIEACPECYAAAHARKPTWFTDVCSTPHILLWAKLKGFPYWPAKGMSVNSSGVVDVRFFGAHDRAWVPAKDCYLYSEKDPNNIRTKKQIVDSMQEAEQHIRNISRKYGKFVYPPFKTALDPNNITEQVKLMIPSFDGELRFHIKEKLSSSSPKLKEKHRSSSKSSKSSVVDGETSESEESRITPLKITDEAEINNKNGDYSLETQIPMNVDENNKKEKKKPSRKRRRSELEEAVITIIQSSSKEKRRRVDKESVTPKPSNVEEVKTQENSNDVSPEKKSADINNIEKSNQTKDTENKELPNSTTDKDEMAVIIPVVIPTNTPKPTQARSTPKTYAMRDKTDKQVTPKNKIRIEKSNSGTKEKVDEKSKEKQRASRRKSFTISLLRNKTAIKTLTVNKDKNKNTNINKSNDKTKSKDVEVLIDTNVDAVLAEKPKATKDRLQFDDDTSLAVLAREVSKTGMPTISSVRSLSEKQPQKTNNNSNLIEVTVDANSHASIFTPTSTDNVKNMKEAVDKLQKLKELEPPVVGRVGVRAFARMKSTDSPKAINTSPAIEIKSEPIDFGDNDRQVEKLEVMNSFRLQPVNPPANQPVNRLREVRINKLVVTPITRKTAPKPPEIRVKAKKTFPQPKKPDERSELTSKNSMVYIPIQPANVQAPIRPVKPVSVNGVAPTQSVKPQTVVSSAANSSVNTITTPLVPAIVSSSIISLNNSTTTTSVLSNTIPSNIGQLPLSTLSTIPALGQMPTNVHNLPFIASMNGQWAFSIQPLMSVGGVDNPSVNGKAERNSAGIVAVPTLVSPTRTVGPQVNQGQTIRKEEAPTQLPRLQQKPLLNPFDSTTTQSSVPPPSTAGPLTAKLNQNAVKLADFFRTLLEESLDKVNEPAACVTSLKLQLEQLQWKHKQELEELKHNHELSAVEMRAAFEREKNRALGEVRRAMQLDLETAVKATKSKQWCANCLQEAQFYCCWNTAYCDYPCQRAHWSQHMSVCTQPRPQENNGNDSNMTEMHTRLQPAPDRQALQKNTTIPNLMAKNVAGTRVYTSEQLQKASLIVSMVEDSSGNQTMKCVGTYKAPSTQVSPLIINKQLLNEETAPKKVTTSGGYFIVGGGNSVTSPRRPTTIQYVHTS